LGVSDSVRVFSSPITNHQSPITNHQSPITNHQSSIINHQSSIINHHPIQLLVAPLPPGFEGGSKGHGVGLN
jgi:hypothetical protein